MGAGREKVVFEAGLDHPPSDCSLETDQARDTEQAERHVCGDFAPGDEVYSWNHE